MHNELLEYITIPDYCEQMGISFAEFTESLVVGYAPEIKRITIGNARPIVVLSGSAKRHIASARFATEMGEQNG